MASIGENISVFRKKVQMSMEELGNLIGVKKQTIQKYESGEIRNIPYEKVKSIATALNISIVDLIEEEDKVVEEKQAILELYEKFTKLDEEQQKIIVSIVDAFSKKNKQ